jgi:phosphate uptake regulator
MRPPAPKYRKILATLDEYGFYSPLLWRGVGGEDKKCFNFLVNGKIEKIYRQRNSCNKQIIKLLKNIEKKQVGSKSRTLITVCKAKPQLTGKRKKPARRAEP